MDTGPQAVLELVEQGLDQRTIADQLNMSQATVSRRVREGLAARKAQHTAILRTLMLVLLTLCAIISTAALATLAWG